MQELQAEAEASTESEALGVQLLRYREDASPLLLRLIWERCCTAGVVLAERAPLSDLKCAELAVWADFQQEGRSGPYERPAWILGRWSELNRYRPANLRFFRRAEVRQSADLRLVA